MNALTTAGSFLPFDKECSQTVDKKRHQTALLFRLGETPLYGNEFGRFMGSLPPQRWHPGAAGQIQRQRTPRRPFTKPKLSGDGHSLTMKCLTSSERQAGHHPRSDRPISHHSRGVR